MGKVKRAAETALRERLTSLGVHLDGNGRAEQLRQVVVGSINDDSLDAALADLRAGSGGELTATAKHRPKFHSAFSSCAFAVNVFGPWRLAPGGLTLDGASDFTTLRFEVQLPIFPSRATPPNLDVLLETDDLVVAIESKLTEYLGGNERASFADRYDAAIQAFSEESWRDIYTLLKTEPKHFKFLNASQLVKHYLGLRRAQENDPRPVTLTYLYWEPADATSGPFIQHRQEVADFAERAGDPDICFRALSYPELWAQWKDGSTAMWVGEHLARLQERYSVSIAGS